MQFLKPLLVAATLCLTSVSVLAAGVCAPGDEKCGPRGTVMKCKKILSDYEWDDTMVHCAGPAATSQGSSSYSSGSHDVRQVCSEGSTQRDVNGYTQHCRKGRWER